MFLDPLKVKIDSSVYFPSFVICSSPSYSLLFCFVFVFFFFFGGGGGDLGVLFSFKAG